MEKSQAQIGPQNKKVLASMDIKSFYPSIDPKMAAKVCREMWEKSEVEVVNVNDDELAWYITKEVESEIIEKMKLQDLVDRKKKQNFKKKIKKANISKKVGSERIKENVKYDPKKNFDKPKRNPSPAERKSLIGLLLESLILVCMTNHVYLFKDKIRLQEKRGSNWFGSHRMGS